MSTPLDDTGDERRTDVAVDLTADPEREFGEVVLYAIAEELGTDPADMPPIAENVDPDVLNRFLDEDGASAKAITFEYLGYDVVLTSDGCLRMHSLA